MKKIIYKTTLLILILGMSLVSLLCPNIYAVSRKGDIICTNQRRENVEINVGNQKTTGNIVKIQSNIFVGDEIDLQIQLNRRLPEF